MSSGESSAMPVVSTGGCLFFVLQNLKLWLFQSDWFCPQSQCMCLQVMFNAWPSHAFSSSLYSLTSRWAGWDLVLWSAQIQLCYDFDIYAECVCQRIMRRSNLQSSLHGFFCIMWLKYEVDGLCGYSSHSPNPAERSACVYRTHTRCPAHLYLSHIVPKE